MKNEIQRIALIGPESTGKTTLCKQLAEKYQTVWVPEFARDYIVQLQRAYTPDDILHCAKEQMRTEDEMTKQANKFLFCDTELIIAKVWCEDIFSKNSSDRRIPAWMEGEIQKRKYALYLLTAPDLAFEDDPVRENPHRREYFFHLYENELKKISAKYFVVTGVGKTRLENALKAIERI